jgi:hypothetical protein
VTHRQFNRASLSVPTCPGGELNTHINTHINIKDNQTSFDNYIQDINTEDVIDLSSETIETGTALKELTPAEIDRMLSW